VATLRERGVDLAKVGPLDDLLRASAEIATRFGTPVQ